jgi:hypothetical protein
MVNYYKIITNYLHIKMLYHTTQVSRSIDWPLPHTPRIVLSGQTESRCDNVLINSFVWADVLLSLGPTVAAIVVMFLFRLMF